MEDSNFGFVNFSSGPTAAAIAVKEQKESQKTKNTKLQKNKSHEPANPQTTSQADNTKADKKDSAPPENMFGGEDSMEVQQEAEEKSTEESNTIIDERDNEIR